MVVYTIKKDEIGTAKPVNLVRDRISGKLFEYNSIKRTRTSSFDRDLFNAIRTRKDAVATCLGTTASFSPFEKLENGKIKMIKA